MCRREDYPIFSFQYCLYKPEALFSDYFAELSKVRTVNTIAGYPHVALWPPPD